MLSVSLSDTSVRRCPPLCPTRPSDAVRLPVRHVRLTLSVLVRHVRLTLSVSVCRSRSRSRFRSRFRSLAVPVPVPVPVPFLFPFPPPASAPAPACVTPTHLSTLENRRRYSFDLFRCDVSIAYRVRSDLDPYLFLFCAIGGGQAVLAGSGVLVRPMASDQPNR